MIAIRLFFLLALATSSYLVRTPFYRASVVCQPNNFRASDFARNCFVEQCGKFVAFLQSCVRLISAWVALCRNASWVHARSRTPASLEAEIWVRSLYATFIRGKVCGVFILMMLNHSMQFDGARINAWGVNFGIVIVKHHLTGNDAVAAETRAAFQPYFPGVPLILASQDAFGRFRFHGRSDLASNLARLDPQSIPWERYTL